MSKKFIGKLIFIFIRIGFEDIIVEIKKNILLKSGKTRHFKNYFKCVFIF